MKGYYAKLPNKIFIEDDKNKESYLQQIKNDKVILIVNYLYTNTNRKGKSFFTLEDMIIECGYKPNMNKGRTNDIFKNILIKMQDIKMILTDINLEDLKRNDYVCCDLNIFQKNELDEDNNYIQLYDSERELIFSYDKEKVDNLTLLKLYCYLKARMYRRKDDKNIQATGGNATVCYPSYAKIEEDINISQASIKKYIDILVDIDLIRYDNAGIHYPKGNPKFKRESANTYCLYDEYDNWKIEIKESIKFYKAQKEENGFVFCKDNTYKNNNRKLNGELGALIRLKNKGKANDKQLKRIDEIRSELSNETK